MMGILWNIVQSLFFQQFPTLSLLLLVILLLFGFQGLCVGILGEYVGRIYFHTMGLPINVIRDRVGQKRENKAL